MVFFSAITLVEDQGGRIWVTSSKGGAWHFDGAELLRLDGVQCANSVYVDGEGSLWFYDDPKVPRFDPGPFPDVQIVSLRRERSR